jgi:membrane protease YdiL (CAAX protease family)
MYATPRSRLVARPISLVWATSVVLTLCLLYIAFNIAYLGTSISEFLGFIPAFIGLLVLFKAGFTKRDCCLQIAQISRRGLILLLVLTFLVVGSMLPFFRWRELDWVALLIYAPATAISQELFFRSTLLPALTRALKVKTTLALLLHAALFGIWHAGVFRFAPFGVGMFVILVPTISGLVWGWQVRKDGTVLWAMLQHTAVQMFMRLSNWG